MRARITLLVLVAVVAAARAETIRLSPPEKVGASIVRIAYVQTDLSWLGEQRWFVIDGRRVALPPASLGYNRVFSVPRWVTRGGHIVGLKFWQFDTAKSLRRVVVLSYPAYRLQARGPWTHAPGGDTVPDPPR